ncbi:MAG: metallophosphoesterase [Dongiaceae bacterium]
MSYFFISIITAITAGDLLWWFHADHLARRARRPKLWRRLIAAFVILQLLLICWMILGRFLGPDFVSQQPRIFVILAYLWHLLLLPLFLLALGAGYLIQKTSPNRPNLSRRDFVSMLVALAPMAAITGIAGYSLRQLPEFRIRKITAKLPSLPKALDGLQIAVLADLHVGAFSTLETLQNIVNETNKLDADLILLPGDLINNTLSSLPDAIAAVTAMKSRYGAYLCLGNHDVMVDSDNFIRQAKEKLNMLIDESHLLTINGQKVQLLGLPWNGGEEAIENSVVTIARHLQPDAFPVLLAHHPHAFDTAAKAGIPLTISGHTHGGQLMINESTGFGPLMFRYWSGLYQKPEAGHASLVVSNGVGHWFPLRVNAPAEIVELTLTS